MTNIKFLKTLTAGFVLSLATCPQAWAGFAYYEEYTDPISGKVVYDSWVADGGTSFSMSGLPSAVTLPATMPGTDNMNIYLAEGVQVVGPILFKGRSSTTITLPDSLTQISSGAFSSLGTNVNVVMSENSTPLYIAKDAFDGTGVDIMDIIPDKVKNNVNAPMDQFKIVEYGNAEIYPYEETLEDENGKPSGTSLYLSGWQEVTTTTWAMGFACNESVCGYMVEPKKLDEQVDYIDLPTQQIQNINNDDYNIMNMQYTTYDGVTLTNVVNGQFTDLFRKLLVRKYKNSTLTVDAKQVEKIYNFDVPYILHGVDFYKKNKGKINRTSYTPAEAAQHVNHTNNNKITFTFK